MKKIFLSILLIIGISIHKDTRAITMLQLLDIPYYLFGLYIGIKAFNLGLS